MAKNNTELATKLEGKANGHGKPLTVAEQVRHALDKMKDQVALALPKHLTPDRLLRIALTTIRTNPKLLECSIESLLAAVMQSAQLGLEPNLLGQCYFVPYWNKRKNCNEVQFQIGYQGLIALARRSGMLVSIAASPIYENDKFKWVRGFDERLEHEPAMTHSGKAVAYYAYAILKDGGRQADLMTAEKVEDIRQRSKAKDSGPWVTDYEEMAKKTVLRRLCKLLPLSVEVMSTIKVDEEKEFASATAIELSPQQLGTSEQSLLPEPEAELTIDVTAQQEAASEPIHDENGEVI